MDAMARVWQVAIVTMTMVGVGCGGVKEERQEEVKPQHLANMGELQEVVGVFHRDMRWSRFEQAGLRVSPKYRPSFMGRYEEFGEDFHVTHLEVKSVTWGVNPEQAEVPRALVEVEQEWYREPNMTLKKERFVEVWEPEGGGWMLTSRLKKEEWQAREKARREGAEAGDLAGVPKQPADPDKLEAEAEGEE